MEICGNSGDICWKYMQIYPVISWHTLNNYKLLNPLGTRNALCIYLETAIPSTDMFLLNRSRSNGMSFPPVVPSSVLAIRSQWWMVFPALQVTLTPCCNPWLLTLITPTAPPNMVEYKWCIWCIWMYIVVYGVHLCCILS